MTEPRITGVARIAAERIRVLMEEGRTREHDATHANGELALAAAAYALPDDWRKTASRFDSRGQWLDMPYVWPWRPDDWKPCPDDRVRELVKAGQLIAAEIDRLRALEDSDD